MLATGTVLGPYKILALQGVGGMGEVYRARDARLGRDVALKVIPADFARSSDRIGRFAQEARAAGALNHPNVCSILDIGTHEGSPYVVMELLEGESLRGRLNEGPIPIRKAVEWAAQAARGLAAAHEKGIVHRDLKPENLFLTKDGRVKVLDFGIAKLTRPEILAPSAKPPGSVPPTETGAILGTAGYMAPEQVRGEPADQRADLFALGAILHELLTGKRAFSGVTFVETSYRILNEEPAPLSAPDRELPAGLEGIVRRCLEKSPQERFQSAHDLAFSLESVGRAMEGPIRAPGRVVAAGRSRWRYRLAAIGALLLAVAALAFLVPRWIHRPATLGLVRFAVTATGSGITSIDGASVAISPDGRRLAVVVIDSTGIPRLWIRSLDSCSAQPLAGTASATLPFWSPDGRFVAYFAEGKLKKIPAGGGAPEVICDAPNGRGGSWSREGVIVFAPFALGPLLRVSAEGGAPVVVARPDSSRQETGLRFPCFLPDGKHYLYVSLPRKKGSFEVYVGTVDGPQRERIMAADGAPIYAEPGYLLFVQGDRLRAQRFDRSRRQPVGAVLPLGDAPPQTNFEGAPLLSASANGVLVHPATSFPNTQLTWLDRAGRHLGAIPLPPGFYGGPCLSPDDRWAAVVRPNSPVSYDLWLVDLERAVTTRLTFEGLVAVGSPIGTTAYWSPDGSQIAYMRNRSGIYDVYQVLTSGTQPTEPLVQSDVVFKSPAAWSPDGKYLVFSQSAAATQWDLWLLPLQGDRKPVPYLLTPFDENSAAISPDGRWLAYDSSETGATDIYVRSFPQPGEKYRVSAAAGASAQWSKDGREMLIWTSQWYSNNIGPVLVVDVQTSPTFRAGTPRVLFTPRQDLLGLAATSDLKRFLAAIPVEGAEPPSVTVVLNWEEALKR